ncbi:GntR family transcriptional regulator [Ancylobacter oerskovii]|uniref:GntR family transcriptional regulator n=1 Tax=Ancylobacter oerskovii TaxID=459519 RepID=A0ABW4Z065_9HYPH|nr:GntR family transcriptional regulator [Ancylobacter oerskovii]MBS7542810.1 GntR family transcriptional regulator [Ancylobacter oerskovii]
MLDELDDSTTVADSALARLTQVILDGELKPGAKVSEPELARRFGISRAPLREAIRRLEERSVLTRAPRLGARVVVLSPAKVEQIFVVREAVEGMIAREAAKLITDAEVAQLRESLARQKARSEEIGFSTFLTRELDSDFHTFIAQCSRNEFLIKFLCEDYATLIGLCRKHLRQVPERAYRAFVEHGRIVDALADRDPDMAELAMRRHIQASRQMMVASVQDPGSEGGRRRRRGTN